MVKVSGLWGRLVRLEGLLACLAVALGTPLFAQRYRLADPVVMPVKGNGWTVDTARGALIGCFPVQTLPGPMPVSLSVRLSGTYSHQEGTVAIGTAGTSPNTLGTISSTSSVATAFPIHALVHFGYIGGGGWAGNADVPIAYVLEDGTQYMDADFGTGTDPNTKFVYPQLNNTSEGSGTVTYFLDAFGLGRTPTQLVPRYSNDLLAATYVANLTDLGSRGSAVQSLNPSGFDASSSSPTSWTILLTSDKARVFTYISDFAAWVPVMWLDKYGHTVTFQWTKSTANLPAGYSAVYSVKVLEPVAGLSAYQYPGILAQWATGNGSAIQDLMRADFINVDAPSLRIQGWAGGGQRPSAVSVDTSNFSQVSTAADTLGPLAFRPTTITVGQQSLLPVPGWLGAGQPLPAMVPGSPNQNTTPRKWTLGYDSNSSAASVVTSITEPDGLQTVFTLGMNSFGLPFPMPGQTMRKVFPFTGNYEMYTPGKIDFYGITKAVSTDSVNAITRTQTWVRDASGGVACQDYFGSTPLKETYYLFNTTGQLGGNATVQSISLRDPSSKAVAKQYSYQYIAMGIDGTLCGGQSTTISFPNSQSIPTTVRNTFTSNYGLQTVQDLLFAGPTNVEISRADYSHEFLPFFLEPARFMGAARSEYYLPGQYTTVWSLDNTYGDSVDPYGYNNRVTSIRGTNNIVKNISYDNNGFPETINIANGSSVQAFTYDLATGAVTNKLTSYENPLGSSVTGSFSINTPVDTMGRPVTVTDENQIKTKFVWDTWGRIISKQIDGEPPLTYLYSNDGLTVTVTQNSISTTSVADQFGRPLSISNPDGTLLKMTYDAANRKVSEAITSNNGIAQIPAAWQYDILDRLVSVQAAGGAGAKRTYTYSISPNNQTWARCIETLALPTGNATTIKDSDVEGRTVWTQDPSGTTTAATYNISDPAGQYNTIIVTDPGSGTSQTRLFMSEVGFRPMFKTEPETGTTNYSNYDALNNPTTITEANGRVWTTAYDGLGRLVGKTNALTGDSVSLNYTGSKLMSSTSISSLGTVTQAYSYTGPSGRLSEEDLIVPGQGKVATNYNYDPSTSRLDNIVYPSGRVIKYLYDSLGRISALQNNGVNLIPSTAYNQWGQLERITFASGAYDDWSMKDGGTHLDKWTLGYTPGGAFSDYTSNPRTYLYDTAERMIKAAEWGLSYDAKGRMVAASAPDLSLVSGVLAHDGFDNNTSSTFGGATSVALNNFTINPSLNNLTPTQDAKGTVTGWTYGNPSNGEASTVGTALGASAPELALAWDGLGRLSQVANGQTGGRESYLYNGSGLRVTRTDDLNSTLSRNYCYNLAGQLLTEFSSAAPSLVPTSAGPIVTYNVQTDFSHQIGRADGTVWSATCGVDTPQLAMCYGPYTHTIPAGRHVARIWLQVDSLNGANDLVATLDVNDATTQTVIARRPLYRHDFSDQSTWGFVPFDLSFVNPAGHQVEIRTWWMGTSSLRESKVDVLLNQPWCTYGPDLSYRAQVDLAHQIGRAEADGWSATCGTDSANEYLAYGPYTSDVPAGSHVAHFGLMVDNVVAGSDVVVTVDVNDATTQQVLAQRSVRRNEFASPYVYQDFELPFDGVPGHLLEFRTSWSGTSYVREQRVDIQVNPALTPTRDVIYLGGRAVAEIDANGVHELHCDHLGTPRIITNGGTGQIEGRQSFGPYGEYLAGVSSGYLPLTGYTGHLQTEPTGLIYMKGRFYSPVWHRFVNSDHGVDSTQANQMAYCGGSPLMRNDPFGLMENLDWLYTAYEPEEGIGGYGSDGLMQTGPNTFTLPNGKIVVEPEPAETVWVEAGGGPPPNQDPPRQTWMGPANNQPRAQTTQADWQTVANLAYIRTGNPQSAALELTKQRIGDGSKAGNWGNVPLKDAEHYMFYRAMVSDNILNAVVAAVCIPLWDARKLATYPLGIDQTPASFTELKAGYMGLWDGIP